MLEERKTGAERNFARRCFLRVIDMADGDRLRESYSLSGVDDAGSGAALASPPPLRVSADHFSISFTIDRVMVCFAFEKAKMTLVALAGNFIRFWNSKNVCMRNFYLWVAVIGLLLTIQGSWKLVQQYAKSPTVTNMKILRNKTIEFLPNATLCLPIRINGNQPPLVFNFSLNSSSFAERLHEEGNWSRRHVLDEGWDLPTLKYFHAVVAIVSEIDRGNPLSSDVRSEKAKILISDTKVSGHLVFPNKRPPLSRV
jgi:hypothetical protein